MAEINSLKQGILIIFGICRNPPTARQMITTRGLQYRSKIREHESIFVITITTKFPHRFYVQTGTAFMSW